MITIWKIDICYSFGSSKSIIGVYYFDNFIVAQDFVKNLNQNFEQNQLTCVRANEPFEIY